MFGRRRQKAQMVTPFLAPFLGAKSDGKGLEFKPQHSSQGSCDIIKPKEGSRVTCQQNPQRDVL